MKIALTGASGFVGRVLSHQLRTAGHEVLALSRREGPGLTTLSSYTHAPSADMLVHLAESSDRHAVNRAGVDAEADAAHTLAALLDGRYRHVVYASSATVYGDAAAHPRRCDEPVQAADSYARIKLHSEQAVLAAAGTVARLANLYGPAMAPGNVLSAILAQVPGHGPLRVQDDTPVRDFLWVDDAAQALVLMAQAGTGGLYNVGSGSGTSVRQLARLALQAAGQDDRPVQATGTPTPTTQGPALEAATALAATGAPAQSPRRSSTLVLDIAATSAAFGWRPAVTLPQGLAMLLDLRRLQSD